MKQITASLVLLTFVLCVPSFLAAQEVASLTGVVTDETGAVVSGANVKLVDTRTNANWETKTNSIGAYSFSKLPPGPGYKLTVSGAGFATVTVADVYLAVSSVRTQNVQMKVGAVTETIEVSGVGQGVTLNTTDATIGNNFDMRSVHELPIQARDSPAALLALQPGVVTAPVGGDDPNSSRDGAVTGARTDQGNITLDGLDVNDFATGQAFATVANAPVDSIQEFRGETANPMAASGRGSGAQISLVTKSGTNQWHGSAYEYHRNTVTEANDFFNRINGVPRPKLIRNQFGTNLGGPVLKDKLFFFFNYQGRREAREDSGVVRVVPLDSFRSGSVSYINNSAGCTFTSRVNTTPNCITTLTPAEVAAIDPLGVGAAQPLLDFMNGRYPHANDLTGGDGINTGGFIFNAPVGRTANDYVSRIDYNLSSKMTLFGRFSILRDTSGDDVNFSAPIQFPGDPLSHTIADHSWAYVIGHTWTISPNMGNQFAFGETRSVLGFATPFNPTDTTQYQVVMNNGVGSAGLSRFFSDGASQARTVPIPIFRDDFSYVHGKHNWQFGGTFKPIKSHSQLVSDFNEVQMGLGGGLSDLGPTGDTTLRPMDLLTPSGTAKNRWDSAFTFVLGRFSNITSSFNNDKNLEPLPQGTGHIRDYRYYETEVYWQDTWRMRSDLTLTYGLRYQYYSVPYEVNGLEAIPDAGFSAFIGPRLQNGPQGIAGPLSSISYNLAGKANSGDRSLYAADRKNFGPRFSFAYNPSKTGGFLGRLFGDRKTVIRGGAGIIFDHPGTNALNFLQDQNTYVLQNIAVTTYPLNSGTASDALTNDPRFAAVGTLPSLNPPSTITVPFTPDPNGTSSGNGLFNYAIDPNLKTPYSMTFTYGVQRELPGNFIFEANYFARLGRRLLSQADAGQVVDFKDPASQQFLASAFGSLAREVRAGATITDQPFFENQGNAATMANYGLSCTDFAEAIGFDPGTSCTQLIGQAFSGLAFTGDLGDTVQALAFNGILLPGVGLHPQFATNLYITNKASSSYNGLLMTLHKKVSHGLQFDFNYTYSHSIDNISAPANQAFGSNGAGGILCDSINLRACRGNSDFDVTHVITAYGIYELPFGRGKPFGGNVSGWLNQAIGGWQLSGIFSWRTGLAFQTVANSFPISFANNVPAIFNGDRSAIETNIHTDPATGQVQLFADPTKAIAAFDYPTGLEAGSRNNLRGPHLSNVNLGIAKHFPITETLGLEFRADAYNAFNHANFALPGASSTADISSPDTFGVITNAGAARVWQFALRLDF